MEANLEAMAGSNPVPDDGVSVHAGFPNPAADRRKWGVKLSLDFNQLLVKRPSSTFVFRIVGHRYADHGIFDGDIAVVDRALPPRDSDVVIRWLEQGFELKRFRQLENPNEAWGVVTAVVHQYER
ncbi:MAG: response UmuD protein Serine peptidase family [Candidatus Saccharibacteria bacterium]|nr:response UmuD protein Serine peptidase family [Candidatus Saccharibacteria bacterium]